MKLSEEVLEAGRSQVRARDLKGLKLWCETHAYTVTWDGDMKRLFEALFKSTDDARAIKTFDSVFTTYDSARDVRRGLARLGCLIFVGLGLLGGVVYLVKLIFF